MIVRGNGMPYERRRWVTLFARYRVKAGVPEHIWVMDLRAAAINDAMRKGATHTDCSTPRTTPKLPRPTAISAKGPTV